MTVLIGREEELSTLVDAVLVGGRDVSAPSAVSITAGAGSGKTALLRAFVDHLGTLPVDVWSARPLQTELRLAFSGLTDLLTSVPDSAYELLPPVQRSALKSALLLEAAEDPADPRAVAAGLRTVLRNAAAVRPVVLVVDDAHWLDDASVGVLGQALARVDTGAILLVAASRPEGRPLSRWWPAWPCRQLDLAPLSAASLFHVIRDHLGVLLDRGQLRAVEAASGGNPLHALEFARHRVVGDSTFDQLLAARIERLPRPTRLALLAAALAGAPEFAIIAAARGCAPGVLMDLLEPAVGSLVRVGRKVEFLHPLFAEAVVQVAAEPDLRDAHKRLAELEPGDEARVRHRALLATGAERGLSDELAAVALGAWDRAARDAAAELMTLAVERDVPGELRAERMTTLGRWLVTIGRPAEAVEWLARVRQAGECEARWEATIELACALQLLGRLEESSRLAAELGAADLSPVLRARTVIMLDHAWLFRRPEQAIASLTKVNAELARVPDEPGLARLRAAGLALEARMTIGEGRPADAQLAEALQLEEREPQQRVLESARLVFAHWLISDERHDEARRVLHELLDMCDATGDDASVPSVSAQLAYLEVRAGNWDVTLEVVEQARPIAEGQHQSLAWLLDANVAMVSGLRGERQRALRLLAPMLQADESPDHVLFGSIAWQIAGGLYLAHGDHELAHDALSRSVRLAELGRWRDPGDLHVDADYVDALIATGRLDEAEAHLADTESRAERLGRDAVLVECGRVRVSLRAARGDLDGSVTAVPAMLAAYDAGRCQPLERGRAHLLAGRLYRRARSKRLAHQHLTAALAIFNRLGCSPYAAQARDQLARVGLRPNAPESLTPAELQVARLAAKGLRNREIAEHVFASQKTVEATLSRIYRKLEIRSRVDLARALAAVVDSDA